MRRRILCFLSASFVVLGSVLSFLPMRAGAVVPVGLIESAFASYAVSSGYQFASAEADDNIFLGLFRELYDDFVTVKEAAGQQIRSWDEYTDRDVYIDNSGQIVVSYGVAQDWAGAMEWIQSHYDIQDGGEAVEVVPPVAGGSAIVSGNVNTVDYPVRFDTVRRVLAYGRGSSITYTYVYANSTPVSTVCLLPASGNTYGWIISCSRESFSYGLTVSTSGDESDPDRLQSANLVTSNGQSFYRCYVQTFLTDSSLPVNYLTGNNVDVNTLCYEMLFGDTSSVGGIAGMAASIASTVIDVAQGATEDDSLVIGVGAAAGSTAAEIAQEVASGIRAGTLEPAVTVTATDVIDTPVQPYPDIDGLGLPSLGAALVSRFPFCVPWDFVDTVNLLNADPVAPDIAVDLFPASFKSKVGVTGSTEFRINLGDEKYQKIGTFCRWGSLISFCFGLAMLTKRMIWTA